jgi:bile acid-coenzyme A ligase
VSETTAAEVSYGRRLTEIASERPDDVDLVLVARDGTETPVTWGSLESRANQIARALRDRTVGKDDIVGLALPASLDHILVTLAIWKLGATLLPLRHDIPQWEMDRLTSLAEPVILVSDDHMAPCPVLTRADLHNTSALDDSPLPDTISEIVNLTASSGSTGNPKLIVTPSRGVISDDPTAAIMLGGANATILVCSPLYHVNGFAFAAPQILEGHRVVVMEKFEAELAAKLIEAHQITFTVMVPTMLQRIARIEGLEPQTFSSINRLIYGGAKIPEWVVDKWIHLIGPEAFIFTYGSSERLGTVSMTGAQWADHRGSTGQPIDCTLSIRDDDNNELPNGEVGHICMRPTDPGRRLFEYIGMPTPGATDDGYRTIGDLGWVDDDGYLYIADRRTDMIITGGANVFPAEVETALSEHPDVVDQVVVPVPDDEWGHRVHAIIQVSDPENPPTTDALRSWCKDRLASYKAPKTYEIVDRVPRTDAGKLNRTELGAERSQT